MGEKILDTVFFTSVTIPDNLCPIRGRSMKRYLRMVGILIAFWISVTPLLAQQPDNTAATDSGSGFKRVIKDVGSDYKNTFSKETAIWYGGGLATAGLVHLVDEDIRDAMGDAPEAVDTALGGGDIYGSPVFQYPLAVGWWALGHALGSSRGADAGRDLLRAQINAMSWTYAFKFAVHRERPNGDKRSFPSGHASATFATAMVLQQHYGWKVGLPFFLGATYTSVSRISDNKHWASDLIFGAAVGMASARTVTLHLRNHKIKIVPVAAPGGAGIAVLPSN
jgi:hypothetical protein